jgi:hypothetical protein
LYLASSSRQSFTDNVWNRSQVNSNATQAARTPTHATRTPSSVPHRPGQPITPASGALRVARSFVPTPETSIPQPSIAQIGAARNAVTAANPNLPAGTPAHGRESLVRFIAITNHAVAPVHAMAILMRANWDLNVALNRHMAQQAGESSEDEDSEDEEGEEGDETNLGDPEPDELPVDEYGQHQLGRPRTNFSAPSRGKDAKNEKVCTLLTFNFSSTDISYSSFPKRMARRTPMRTPKSTVCPLAVTTQMRANRLSHSQSTGWRRCSNGANQCRTGIILKTLSV